MDAFLEISAIIVVSFWLLLKLGRGAVHLFAR